MKSARPGSLPSNLSRPAQGALAAVGITNLKKLSRSSEAEILALHGMGPKSIPILKKALAESGLSFASKKS